MTRSPDDAPRRAALAALTGGLFLLVACGGGEKQGDSATRAIAVDGSSTVYPVTQAAAEEFMGAHPGTRVSVGYSGTGGGFKKFCRGETDISDASRLISPEEEELCEENGVEYRRLAVASDGITVVANPGNNWARCIAVEELRRIWEPGSTVNNWGDVRPDWPDREMPLFGPGTDSGTFDYFTEAIMGQEASSRSDFTASEDDNVLVMGVSGDPAALGYFGYAYFDENRERLKALEVDPGDGCVAPNQETIESGEYRPLSRPLYIYVREEALQEAAVLDFVRYYMDSARELVPQVGYVPLSAERYREQAASLPPSGDAGDTTSAAGDTTPAAGDTTAGDEEADSTR